MTLVGFGTADGGFAIASEFSGSGLFTEAAELVSSGQSCRKTGRSGG